MGSIWIHLRKVWLLAAPVLLVAAAGVLAFVSSGMPADNEVQPSAPLETHDDLLQRVARQVSGFGGMFIDEDGRLAVYLLDTAQLGAAEAAIATVFGPERIPLGGVRALQGQYSVTQLKQWHDRLGDLFAVSSVTLTDLDEAKNRVRVGVEDDAAVGAVEQALRKLGVPREAVIIELTGPVTPVRGR